MSNCRTASSESLLQTPQVAEHSLSDAQRRGAEGDDEAVEVGGDAGEDGELGPRAQVMSTACWLTMKEASFLLGHLVQSAPLSGARPLLPAGGTPRCRI